MKKILALILAAITLLTLFVSCAPTNNEGDDTGTQQGSENDTQAPTPVDINVYTLNGTTGFGMAKLISDAKKGTYTTENYTFTVQSDASVVLSALINGDVDIAALPTNAAANVYNKSNGEVKILAVNTRGVLYLLAKGETTVSSFEALRGKTVYVPAQNPTFIFTHLCKQNGLIPGTDITIDSTTYAEAAALRDAVASGLVDYAVLPEPMVTIAMASAKKANVTLTNAMDLTAEWDKVCTPGSLVQGCVVVRKAFLEAHPEAVSNFLKAYKSSIEYLTSNTAEAAQLIVEAGIFTNATVAANAIPKCNVCYLDGAEMKTAMEVFLTALKDINANSIGGKLPADDFYYNAQ